MSLQLIFSVARYEAVIDAYLDGLEASGLSDLSRVTSVASFFVSRVDSLIDKMLEKIGTPEALALRGKVETIEVTCDLIVGLSKLVVQYDLSFALITTLCSLRLL